jgi:DNA-damage-inducible protein D
LLLIITILQTRRCVGITNFNVKKDDLKGEKLITREHVKNNADVRKLLLKSKIKPESLPPEEDIKKLERKVKADEKRIARNSRNNIKTKPGKRTISPDNHLKTYESAKSMASKKRKNI